MNANGFNNGVLIVDDEIEICFLLTAIMRRKNIRAYSVHTIADAKKEVEIKEPKFLFLDINLPDGSGLDLLSQFHKQYPGMKIIIISAFDTFKEKAFEKGAFSFLSKPFSKNAVLDILS